MSLYRNSGSSVHVYPSRPFKVLPRVLLALSLAILAIVHLPYPAQGHASVLSTLPSDGSELTSSPESIEIAFNERVSVPEDGVRLIDERGDSRPVRFEIEEALSGSVVRYDPGRLADGWYAVSWRAFSADTHPISGAFTFRVGASDLAAGEFVFELADPARPFLAASHPLRAILYILTALALGLMGAAWAASGPRTSALLPEAAANLRRMSVGSAIAGIAIVALATINSAFILNAGSTERLGTVLQLVMRSSSGAGTLVRLSALFALCTAVLLMSEEPTRKAGWVVASIGGTALVYSFAMAGHASIVPYRILSSVSVSLHLAAGAAWLGGVPGVLYLASRRRHLDKRALSEVVERYSRIATASVVMVLVGGTAAAYTMLESPLDLFTSRYGLSLLAKFAIVLMIGAVGAYNHYVLVPALRSESEDGAEGAEEEQGAASILSAPARLRASLGFESLGLVAVVIATAAVTSSGAPAAGWSDGLAHLGHQHGASVGGVNPRLQDALEDVQPVISFAQTSSGEARVSVSPGRAGSRNTLFLEVKGPEGQPLNIEEAEMTLSNSSAGIEGIVRDMRYWRPGEMSLTTGDLAVSGEWQLEVYLRMEDGTVDLLFFDIEMRERNDAR